jgi:Tfp pilus assembly protein PilN
VLRTNLSTRPFYNERAVHALAALIGIVVLALTAWQAVRIVRLSRYKTELNAAIERDRNEADRRVKEAAQVRRGLDQKQLSAVASAAKEANDLIERRTFSWTALFNQLETTLPENVMLTAVHPEFKEGETQIRLEVQGRRSDDIDAFWDRLEKTGQFRNIQWTDVTVTEEGIHKLEMKAEYTPTHQAARPASASAVPEPAAGGVVAPPVRGADATRGKTGAGR